MINNICSENAKQLNYILNNASQSTLSSIPRESLQNVVVVVVVECSKIFHLFQCKNICSIKCLAEPKIFLNLLWNYYEVCGRYCLYRGIHSRPVYHQNIAYQCYLDQICYPILIDNMQCVFVISFLYHCNSLLSHYCTLLLGIKIKIQMS